jgi:hypothetical protein
MVSINAQIMVEKIFEKKYSELPFSLRIENSGIYSIASFDVEGNQIAFKSYDDNKAYLFDVTTNQYSSDESTLSYDVVLSDNKILSKINIPENYPGSPFQSKKIFSDDVTVIAFDEDGVLKSGNKILASVMVTPEMLEISSDYLLNRSKTIFFPKSLAYSTIVGIDKYSNHFILVEEFESQIPLQVKRTIISMDKRGAILSSLTIPMVKYLSLLKEFQIDADGNLYHLFTLQDKVSILKISGLTTSTEMNLNYPVEYQKDIHYNYFVTTDEYAGDIPQNTELASSRLAAVRIGETYVLHKYRTTSSNLAPSNTTGPDGDIVRTPAWLIEGVNAKVPYKWGGFQTIAQFDAGLVAGKYAGDIHTSGVSSHAVGVDCSGFVSRCWQLTYHSATSMMPDITTQYTDWNLLRPGDAIHKVGHVRLFLERNQNGSFKIVEASGRDWGVAYWSYTASDLSTYTPRYYNSMASDYSFNRPELLKAEIVSDKVQLTWNADTTGISSFKIYASSNGKDWTEIQTVDSSVKTTIIPITNNIFSFRISSVSSDASQTEGNWSNVLSAKMGNAEEKVLIVDGFERDNGSGSWQGPGHTFVNKYAAALNTLDKSYESIKNSLVSDSSVLLQNYESVYWILGDESTEHETFNSTEQALVKSYLESGGQLFVSGSEIGWDLSYRGSVEDKAFYNNYLKANYISDGAGVLNALGASGSIFDGLSVRFGQTYEEDYPDEINAANGSSLCFNYSNNKGAGILYTGVFGSSTHSGKLIHFAFPVETIADDSTFNLLITKSSNFFDGITSIEESLISPSEFSLSQNYPNPFNPSTIIEFNVPIESVFGIKSLNRVVLKVYDLLGNEIAKLVDEDKSAGHYSIVFIASDLASGVYFYTLNVGAFSSTRKMVLIR